MRGEVVMEKTYTAEELLAIAVQTALEFGTDMVGWWQDEDNPRQLYIEARTQAGDLPIPLTACLLSEGPLLPPRGGLPGGPGLVLSGPRARAADGTGSNEANQDLGG